MDSYFSNSPKRPFSFRAFFRNDSCFFWLMGFAVLVTQSMAQSVPGFENYQWDSRFIGPDGIAGTVNIMAMGNNDEIYVGGTFSAAISGGEVVPALNVAVWKDGEWSALGKGIAGDSVRAMKVGLDGRVYVGGFFEEAGGLPAQNIAVWDGVRWGTLGEGMDSFVFTMEMQGEDLYAGGGFTSSGNTLLNGIGKWDGSSWTSLGSGLADTSREFAFVVAYSSFIDSQGDLLVGGQFTSAGGVSAKNIARWDGSSWTALGNGVHNPQSEFGDFGDFGDFSAVYAITENTDNENLIVGGDFSNAGNIEASNIASWDGSVWIPLGAGINQSIRGLGFWNGDIYASGFFFSQIGEAISRGVAKWDGVKWTGLEGGLGGYGLGMLIPESGGVLI